MGNPGQQGVLTRQFASGMFRSKSKQAYCRDIRKRYGLWLSALMGDSWLRVVQEKQFGSGTFRSRNRQQCFRDIPGLWPSAEMENGLQLKAKVALCSSGK